MLQIQLKLKSPPLTLAPPFSSSSPQLVGSVWAGLGLLLPENYSPINSTEHSFYYSIGFYVHDIISHTSFYSLLFNFIWSFKIACVIVTGCNKSSNTDMDKGKLNHLSLPPPIPPPKAATANGWQMSFCTFPSARTNTHRDPTIRAPMLRQRPEKAQMGWKSKVATLTDVAWPVLRS